MDANEDARRSLALPSHARSMRWGGRVWALLSMILAVLLGLFGIVTVIGVVAEVARGSFVTAWIEIPVGIACIVAAVRMWRVDQSLLRQLIAVLLVIKGLAEIVFAIGYFHGGLGGSWIQFLIAAILFGVAWGVWTARDWARRALGSLGVILCVVSLVMMNYPPESFVAAHPAGVPMEGLMIAMVFLMAIGPALLLAIYSVHPSTKRHFAAARAGKSDANVEGVAR